VVRKPQCSSQVFGLIACLCLVGVAGGQGSEHQLVGKYQREIRQRTSTLDSIKSELEQGRMKVAQLQEREQSSLAILEQTERNITMAERYLLALTSGLEAISTEIDSLEVSLAGERRNLRTRRAAMERRLVSMYKVGSVAPLEIFADLRNPIDLLQRAVYFRRLKAYDEHLIRAIRTTKDRIEADKQDLESARAEQEQMLKEKQSEQRRLLAERESRQQVLSEVQAEKEEYLQRIVELETAQKQLLVLIKQLESRKAAAAAELEKGLAGQFAKRKGKLAWPVTGPVAKGYGRIVHPVYKTVTVNNGIDIGVKGGEPVQCVAPGTVAYIGRMRGLGRFVVVDHHSGFLTIYANLASVSVTLEQRVELGSPLGRAPVPVAGGAGATVHFELRQSTSALDPLEWLE
jgi:murein hydrolase activator